MKKRNGKQNDEKKPKERKENVFSSLCLSFSQESEPQKISRIIFLNDIVLMMMFE